jgi:glycosyltransferase involved in cell wall biosynthesis
MTSKTMKILFVNNFRSRGGGEEFLRELLPGLLRKGIQVGLVCRPNTPLVEMFQGSGIDVYPLDRSGTAAVTSVFKIATILREQHYQIVNIQRGHDIIQSLLASWISGQRPVLMYTPQVPEFIRSRFLLRRMDAIATISRHIRDGLISFDPALASRITILYYGIDLGKFKPSAVQRGWLRKRFGLAADTKIIGTVGDLWKNQIEFLDALAVLRERFSDVRYAIVGTDSGSPAVDAFKQRAVELGLAGSVLWPGRLAKDDMLSFYTDIDVAVSTYRNEGFGIWILEAMAMGKPVVSFNAGGIRDSLENSPCGILVDGGAAEMAGALSGLLGDDVKLRTMAEAAPGWVQNRFGRERMVDDYERYFRTLLHAHRGVDA